MKSLSLLVLLPLLALLGTITAAPKPPTVKRPGLIHRRGKLGTRYPNQVDTSAPHPSTVAPKKNIWGSLSFDEAASVKQFLHDQPSMNLTAVEDAGDWDNIILTAELVAPNKTAALSYMDQNGEEPVREALVSILFGQYEEPYVQTFKVALPISESTVAVPNTFGSSAAEAKIRVYDQDYNAEFIGGIAMEMKDIISDLLDVSIVTDADLYKKFQIWGIDPLWHEVDENGKKQVINWVQLWRNSDTVVLPSGGEFLFDDGTLLPQGLYIGVDIAGRDTSKWSLIGVYYGGNFYPTIEEFRAAWEAPGFVKLPINYGGEWSATDKQGNETLPYDTLPPPRQIQPGGQRFEVDVQEKYVKWMDFEFYITFTRDTGLRLYDIKLKGERIIFELGLQEAVAHYAGSDPVQSGIGYLDSYYGFGPYAFNLVPGYDVPFYSQCLEATYHQDEESTTHACGIAIFEADQNYLLQRHTTGSYVSTTKNIALTVRSVNTIGNYDYQFDYIFYMDGTIETLVRASGYIQTGHFANNSEYGYHIHDALSGSMHDHILTFKADIDILGTNNTMVKHTFTPTTEKYPWSSTERNTMKLTRKDIETEDEGKMNWAANGAEQVLIVNKDKLNKFGEEPGFKIMPHRGGGMHNTILNSTNLKNSQEFTKHQYFVTKCKDSEQHVTSPWNAYDVENPLIDFGTYFDGESLVQEDLVVWYNLGMHHVPHTGDLPNTVFTTAQSSVMITPHNYFMGDISRASSQMLRVNYDDDGATDVETFGQETAVGKVDMEQIAWDPYTYKGDESTRKFPYAGLGNGDTEDTNLGGSSPTRRMLGA